MEVILPFVQSFEEKSRELTAKGYIYMLVASPKGSSTCFVSSPPVCKTEKLRVTYDSAIKECTYLLTGKRPLAAHFVELPRREQELADLKAKLEVNRQHLKSLEEKHAKEKEDKADAAALKKVTSAKGAFVTRYTDQPKKHTIFFRENVFFDDTKSGVLFFSEGKERTESAANGIPLASITCVSVGKRSSAWTKPFNENANALCCLSIIAKEHTLDIETKLPKTRDAWVRGLIALARSKGIQLKVEA